MLRGTRALILAPGPSSAEEIKSAYHEARPDDRPDADTHNRASRQTRIRALCNHMG